MSLSPSRVARNGAWTPWASVLCVECEHADLKSSSRGEIYAKRLKAVIAMSRQEEVEQLDGTLLGRCDQWIGWLPRRMFR